jgi:hypothetical protein
VIFPGTGPGGYFARGSPVRVLDDEARGDLMIRKIARTLVRARMEDELGQLFGLDRQELRSSLQIEMKPNRPFPNVSLKWNSETRGTTDRPRIENATVSCTWENIFRVGGTIVARTTMWQVRLRRERSTRRTRRSTSTTWPRPREHYLLTKPLRE